MEKKKLNMFTYYKCRKSLTTIYLFIELVKLVSLLLC